MLVSLPFVKVMERQQCTKMGKLNASNHIKMWSELQFDAWLTENT